MSDSDCGEIFRDEDPPKCVRCSRGMPGFAMISTRSTSPNVYRALAWACTKCAQAVGTDGVRALLLAATDQILDSQGQITEDDDLVVEWDEVATDRWRGLMAQSEDRGDVLVANSGTYRIDVFLVGYDRDYGLPSDGRPNHFVIASDVVEAEADDWRLVWQLAQTIEPPVSYQRLDTYTVRFVSNRDGALVAWSDPWGTSGRPDA